MSLKSLNFFLTVLPDIFFWGFFALAALLYFSPNVFLRFKITSREYGYRILLQWAIGLRLAYAALLTLGQYFLWSGDTFSQALLRAPLGKSVPLAFVQNFQWLFNTHSGYFLVYSWGHFWLNAFLSLLIAALFWQFLALLRHKNERFFEGGEVELGFLSALIAGWPNVILFIAFTFVCVIMLSVLRGIFLKELYTTLGIPFLLSIFCTLLLGSLFLTFFDLSVLRI